MVEVALSQSAFQKLDNPTSMQELAALKEDWNHLNHRAKNNELDRPNLLNNYEILKRIENLETQNHKLEMEVQALKIKVETSKARSPESKIINTSACFTAFAEQSATYEPLTIVQFPVEYTDCGSNFNPTFSIFTCGPTGLYYFFFSTVVQFDNALFADLGIFKNDELLTQSYSR